MLVNGQLDLFPIWRLLRHYNKSKLKGDLRAGFNVALLAFPQGMAYALIAGLPIQYGIYGSIIAAVLGAIFSRSHFIVLGPTNAPSIVLMSAFAVMGIAGQEKLALIPLLLVMVGVLLIIGAYLRVANLTEYISRSVITGYITAAALLIIANQIRNILGFGFPEQVSTFYDVCRFTLLYLGDYEWPSLVLGLLTLGVYLPLQQKLRTFPNIAITLIIMSFIAYGMQLANIPFGEDTFLQSVSVDTWKVTLPVFNFDAISELANTALAVALLCILEGVSIGKSLAARSGVRLNTNQEMMAMGIANIGCGLFSGVPASGSLTRSTLNLNSGASTALSSLFNGFLCVIGLLVFGSFIGYIPRPTLAVLVSVIGVMLINRHAIRIVTRSTRSDAVVFYTTLLSGLLFPLNTAIYFGVGLSIALFLRKARTPEMVEYQFNPEGQLTEIGKDEARSNPEISIVHVEGHLFFGAAELFRDQVRRVFEDPNLKVVILKMRNARHLDATSVMALEELILYMKERERTLLVSEARKDVVRIFKKSGLLKRLGRENIFADISTNPTLSSAKALKRAQKIIGDEKVRVSIYARETGSSGKSSKSEEG